VLCSVFGAVVVINSLQVESLCGSLYLSDSPAPIFVRYSFKTSKNKIKKASKVRENKRTKTKSKSVNVFRAELHGS